MGIINKVHVLIGTPASGKSTWAKNFCESTDKVWLSSDTIRKELYGSEKIQDNPQKIFSLMFERTCAALSEHRDVVYDATNLSRKRRIDLIKKIKDKFPKTLIFGELFATPYEVCLERNSARARTVPSEAMVRMYKSFEIPTTYEGFDAIFLRTDNADVGVLDERLSEAMKISQENHHHTLTIGEHCLAAQNYVVRNWKEISNDIGYYWTRCLEVAARYHDLGKIFCKTNVRPNGVIDTEYHFYNHENVGAYDFLCYADNNLFSKQMIQDIALLINLHMIPHQWREQNKKNKTQQIYGEHIWKVLLWLNKADMAAH